MINLDNIDILAITSAETTLKRTASTEGGNYGGKCPVCGDKDDFYCLPEHIGNDGKRRGQCACRECHPQRMDAIEYLKWARNMSYKQAIEHLHEQYSLELPDNWNEFRGSFKKTEKNPPAPVYRVKPLPMSALPPSQIWQERGKLAVTKAEGFLWDEKIGKEAREYLHGRGLKDETIKAAGLGFIPEDTNDDPLKWGLNPDDVEKVFISRGIIFPYMYKGDLWKLRVRSIEPNTPKDKRYRMVSGSSNGLYRADTIKSDAIVVLFEGEIDALSAAQSMGINDEGFACVATGSTSHARIPKWAMLMGRAQRCLLCFDADGAGSEALDYWSKRLQHACVLHVIHGRKDANDMLIAGDDLCEWLVGSIGGIAVSRDTSVIPNETIDTNVIPEPEPIKGVNQTLEKKEYWHDYEVDYGDHGYDVTYLSYSSDKDTSKSPYAKYLLEAIKEFESDHVLRQFDLYLKETGQTIAYFTKWDSPDTQPCTLKALRSEIGQLARIEDASCEHSDELDPRWPPDANVYEPVTQNNTQFDYIPRRSSSSIPGWLVPGSKDWDKGVERCGIEDMRHRRDMWFFQNKDNGKVVVS